MAWGFVDWARGKPFRPDPDEVILPANPSRRQVERAILGLLEPVRAYEHYKAVRPHADMARPVLESLVQSDARFRSMSVELPSWSRPVFDVALTILFEWKSAWAETQCVALADSADPALRATAARLLACTGEAGFAPVLVKLSQDREEPVRRAVGHGLGWVQEYGKLKGRSLEPALASSLYDYLLKCMLRKDRGPGNGFAALLFQSDRIRAAADLDPDRILHFDLNWLHDILLTLEREAVPVLLATIARLFDDVVEFYGRSDFDKDDRPSINKLAADLVCMATRKDPAVGSRFMAALRNHPQREARNAAQRARKDLSPNPMKLVFKARRETGTDLPKRPEHRIAYLVWKLDAEVTNGGWLQYVANSSGELSPETVAALETVGAPIAAEELRKVIAALGPDGISIDQDIRTNAIDRMMTEGRSLPDEQVIWDMSSELHSLIYDYAEAHPEAFHE
jgi:hypothetical protein